MAVPRRDTVVVLTVCLLTHAMTEYIVITHFIQPLPSTRRDWQFGTLFVAPMSAWWLLWIAALTARIVLDIWTFLRFLGRLITGEHDDTPHSA